MNYSRAAGAIAGPSMFICNQFDMLVCSLKNIRATAMTRTGRFAEDLR